MKRFTSRLEWSIAIDQCRRGAACGAKLLLGSRGPVASEMPLQSLELLPTQSMQTQSFAVFVTDRWRQSNSKRFEGRWEHAMSSGFTILQEWCCLGPESKGMARVISLHVKAWR